MPTITIYGRPGCHLCDAAELRVRELAAECGVDVNIESVNIELDDDLHKRLLGRIPVVEIAGAVVGELGDFRKRSFSDRVRAALTASY